MSASDPSMLAREYATSERLERRRSNVTGWLRGEEAWDFDEPLARHFGRLEHRDTEAQTLWEHRVDLQEYLDAFRELMGPMTAPEDPYPFKVTRRNRVYVGEKT